MEWQHAAELVVVSGIMAASAFILASQVVIYTHGLTDDQAVQAVQSGGLSIGAGTLLLAASNRIFQTLERVRDRRHDVGWARWRRARRRRGLG
jgi:hypothetical protein